MKKYTKKIMAMVTVAATMVTGTAIPVMADDAPTIRLITWLTPSNPAQKPSYDAIESFADDRRRYSTRYFYLLGKRRKLYYAVGCRCYYSI